MKKSAIKQLPSYFDRYINLVEDIDLKEAFDQSIQQIDEFDISQLKKIGLQLYAPNKWSVHKIIQHLIDWERIFGYRTLLAVRQEGTIPRGLDEEIMGTHSNADDLPIEQLLEELRAVRIATNALFSSFNDQMLLSACKFSTQEMSVLAMGFNIIGHQVHHFNIIKERYFPLI